MKNINTICVCGAGTMGSGIAQLCAQSGLQTILFDVNEDVLAKSKKGIQDALQKLAEKGKIDNERKIQALQSLRFTNRLQDCMADFVIEAIVENKNAKIDLFTHLAANNSPETILTTNTSSISVSEIAAQITQPSRFAGMHFFNPAPVMKLVEIVRAKQTDENTIYSVVNIAKQLNKIAVVCKDSPGFIVNRVARHYYLEAMKLVEDDLANAESIDALMEATGFKMGPFKLMDLIGIDINYSVSKIVWEALGKPERLTPSGIQKAKIEKGEFGRKAGTGFYKY